MKYRHTEHEYRHAHRHQGAAGQAERETPQAHGGLYLYIAPAGAKSWRYDYRLHGRRETLTLGRYPETSLAEARVKHAEARRKVAHGESPAATKRSAKRAEKLEAVATNTFCAVAQEWYHAKAPHRSESWRGATRRWLDKELYPVMGSRQLAEITPADVLDVMRRIEGRGAARSAGYVRLLASQVFQHAIRNLRASYDPAQSLKGALVMPQVKHRAPLLAKDIPTFIEALDAYPGTLQTKLGIKALFAVEDLGVHTAQEARAY